MTKGMHNMKKYVFSLMPVTRSKQIWACLPLCYVTFTFNNIQQTIRKYGNYIHIYNIYVFIKVTKLYNSCLTGQGFGLHNAQNIFNSWQVWTALRPIQYPQSLTTKPCSCDTYRMWLGIVLLKKEWTSLKRQTAYVENSICCSKNLYVPLALKVPSQTCLLPMPWALTHPHTIRDASI